MENGQTHLEKTFLEGDILSISVYERNLFFLVELFHLFSRVRKFYEGIEGRCQAKYESLIVRDVKTHFSQKSHCNHNCNDFSDYDDIIAPLDKMIMLHYYSRYMESIEHYCFMELESYKHFTFI